MNDNSEPKKEYDKMTENYQNVQHTEFLMVHTLNLTRPYAWICAGLVFEIRASHQYGKYDAMLCWIKENREKRIIVKIELEFGKNQKNWDTDISREEWRRGISLLKRKDYDVSQLFIKMSPTYNSIILVNTTDNFVQNNTISDTTPHNMGFVTHKDCYVFPWETVDKNLFIIAGGSIYQDGNIFLVQKGISTLVEERKKMYEFINHKYFLSNTLKNLIKSYEQE